jgi:hypothetical protein
MSGTVHRRRGRVGAVALALVAVCLLAGACTPAQFQQWWVSQGHAPLQEPELSRMADAATTYWAEVARRNRFSSYVTAIDRSLHARMLTSWRPGCPVPLEQLRYVQVSYMGFDGGEHVGELMVNADAVAAVVGLFHVMWDEDFPIARMQLVDDFGGSDDASMAANNTSAFNCRTATGSSSWSEHAYGRAVDINPVQNPYVAGGAVQPAAGAAYLDRGDVRPGMIAADGVVAAAVRFIGWGWGGTWSSPKDYMHVSADGR